MAAYEDFAWFVSMRRRAAAGEARGPERDGAVDRPEGLTTRRDSKPQVLDPAPPPQRVNPSDSAILRASARRIALGS